MKNILLFLAASLSADLVLAQYTPVEQGSSLNFKIKNFGFGITGSFTGIHGKVIFDPANPAANSVDLSVDATTVNTDNSLRDNHLRGKDYFDVQQYPTIHFVSSKMIPAGKNAYTVSGRLTIRDKTRDLSFQVMEEVAGEGYLFKGSFPLNRRDFGVGGASTISDNLEVTAIVQCKKM